MRAPPDRGPDDRQANPYRSFPDEASGAIAAGATGGGDSPSDLVGAGGGTAGTARPFRVRWLAVLVGYGSDYLLTEVLDRIWWTSVARRVASGLASMPSETTSLVVLSLLGSSSSVVGGFVCGTMARQAEVKHAVVQLVLGFLIFVLQVWTSGGWGLPGWYYCLTIPAVSAATVLGAWLAEQRRLRRQRGEL